jgi:membrane protease YdiL (CAAX protease family)
MVVVLVLLIAGAILALVATALPWGWAHLDGGGRLPVSGRDVAPDYQVLPLLALASVVGVVATRRVGRVLVGLALAVAAVVAGGWIAVRGPRWPSMGRRYERTPQPPPAERLTSRETWDALDRGDDPTT